MFFQLHILLCSFLQLHSSCKFQLQILFPLGETFASSSIIETWHLIRICLLVFAPANASPNVNRICNWNLQLECNWNATAHKNMQLENTGKLKETAYMSLCSWGQWLVMWAFCMTWRCWFCLVPHEEYLSLVCEQKATKQVEFIRYSDRLVALYPQSPH